MPKPALEDLTESEIRLLLRNRYQKQRQQRLNIYRKTGRAYLLVWDALPSQGRVTTNLDWSEEEPKDQRSISGTPFIRGVQAEDTPIGVFFV